MLLLKLCRQRSEEDNLNREFRLALNAVRRTAKNVLLPRPDGEARTDVWLASSADHGDTWRAAHVAGPFDMHTARLSNRGDFVGDYEGLASLPRGFAAAFVMARPLASVGPTDVFFASLPP